MRSTRYPLTQSTAVYSSLRSCFIVLPVFLDKSQQQASSLDGGGEGRLADGLGYKVRLEGKLEKLYRLNDRPVRNGEVILESPWCLESVSLSDVELDGKGRSLELGEDRCRMGLPVRATYTEHR